MQNSSIQQNINAILAAAVEALRSGGTVLIPCDTGWGMVCDATNESAIQKLKTIASCTVEKRIGLIVDGPAKIQGYVDEMPDLAWDLIEMSTKPLTIVYEGTKNLPGVLTQPDSTIGIRVVSIDFARKLCERFRKPLVFKKVNITNELKNQVDYFADIVADKNSKSQPASVIRLGKGNRIKLIRE